MLALEFVTGLSVIESSELEVHDREFLAVVFRVATGALLARRSFGVVKRVQSFSRCDSRCNLRVAGQTLVSLSPGRDLVASGAVGYSIDRLVGPRERSRRNLTLGRNCAPERT